MKKIINVFPHLFVLFCFSMTCYGQMAKLAPFQVMKSTLIDQLKALKTANPKMTATEFAEKANVLLDANGIGFAISFDSTACERLKKVKEQLKDPNAPLKLGATLKSVDAEGASLALPEPLFASTECGGCYIELPLLQVTEKDFITMIAGRNIKFHLPSNFHVNEAFLLDAKDQTTMKKKWRIPFRSTPIGVSYDENVLYLGFFEQELFELSLMVFGEGVFQITTRADAENGGNGKLVEPPILIRSNPLTQAIRFDRWRNAYLIGFQRACQR